MLALNPQSLTGSVTTGLFRQTNAYAHLIKRDTTNEKWALIGPGYIIPNPILNQIRLGSKSPQFSEFLRIAELKGVKEIDVYDSNKNVLDLCRQILIDRKNIKKTIANEQNGFNKILQMNELTTTDSKKTITYFSKKYFSSTSVSKLNINFYQLEFPINKERMGIQYDVILATLVLENNSTFYEQILKQLLSSLKNKGTLYVEQKTGDDRLSSVINSIRPTEIHKTSLPVLIKGDRSDPMVTSRKYDTLIYVAATSIFGDCTAAVTTLPIAALTKSSKQWFLVKEKEFRNNRSEYWFARAKESKTLSEKHIVDLNKVREQSFECSRDPNFYNFSPLHIAAIRKNTDMIEYFIKYLPESAWKEKDAFDLTPRDYPIELS